MIKTNTAARVKRLPAAMALAMALLGSSLFANAAGEEAPKRMTVELEDRPISSRWIGYAIGLQNPRVEPLGAATIRRRHPGPDAGYAIPDKAAAPHDSMQSHKHPAATGVSVLRLVNYRTKEQYRITIDTDELQWLRAALASNKAPAARHNVPARDRSAPGRSTAIPSIIGDDTRVRITPTTVFPYSAIVYLTNWCSGALIADNIVLTAAHCVVNGGVHQDPGYEEIWYDFAVIPALDRDPACAPGDHSEGCQVMPFGAIEVESVAVADGWLEAKGGGNGGFFQHEPYDWVDDLAVVTLQEAVGQLTGTFDYRALTEAQTTNAGFLNRGYPAPSSQEPPGYEWWQMFGDANYCWVDHFLAEVDSVNRLFSQSCDTSGGHSGSPIYQWRVSLDQGWRPEIAGVVSHNGFGNNYARRIVENEEVLDLAVSFGIALLMP